MALQPFSAGPKVSGSRPKLEIADIFRDHGPAFRFANKGHNSLAQLKVMNAIERCRTAVLGGHVARCEDCAHEHIAYNSCRNRHCPKCQAGAGDRAGRAGSAALCSGARQRLCAALDFYDANTDWDALGLDAGSRPPPTGIDIAAMQNDQFADMTGALLGSMQEYA